MEKFRNFMDSMPKGQFDNIKKQVIDTCIITEDVYKNWYYGRTKVPPLHQKVIEELAGEKVFSNEINLK